jgi:hypothetical protein
MILFLGYVAAAFTTNKCALHDYLTSTRVVCLGDTPQWRKRVATGLGVLFGVLLPFAPMALDGKNVNVERARLTEAFVFIRQVKDAQERYLGGHGSYVQSNSDLQLLGLPRSVTELRFFEVTLGSGSFAGCSAMTSNYVVTLARVTLNHRVSPRYGAYRVMYDRCTDTVTFPKCSACDADFK